MVRTHRYLVFSFAAICVLSVPVFCTRFLNDMDFYSLVADKLLRGALLYRDAIDTKPPLVFLHYALVFRLFGATNLVAIKIVTMLVLAASALAVAAIRKELFPDSRHPEFAALLFVLASFSGWGEDFLSSNTEILSNLFVLAAVWCMVKDDFSGRAGSLAAAGVLTGVASLYRYQSGAPLLAYVLTMAAMPRQFPRPWARLLWLAAGFVVPFALLVGYYAGAGALGDLLFFLRYQSYYVRPNAIYWPQLLGQLAIVLSGLVHFLVLAAWQVVVWARGGRRSRRSVFLALFLLISMGAFVVGSHYFAHYIVQAIPALALLAAERLPRPRDAGAAADARPGWRGWYLRRAPLLIVLQAAAFWAVNLGYYATRVDPPPSAKLIRFIRARTSAAEPVFVWTQQNHILFAADRVYATRFLSNEMLTGRQYGSRYRRDDATAEEARPAAVPQLWPLLLADLAAAKPRIVVDDTPERSNFTLDHYPALAAFVDSEYEPCREIDGFCVYVRKEEPRLAGIPTL